MPDNVGYEEHVCHFCGEGGAAYQRREDGGSKKYFDACEACARKEYKRESTDESVKAS